MVARRRGERGTVRRGRRPASAGGQGEGGRVGREQLDEERRGDRPRGQVRTCFPEVGLLGVVGGRPRPKNDYG